MHNNGIGALNRATIGAEVYHKPGGETGRITGVIPAQQLVYAEDVKF
jgi:hypothetical protein